MAMHQEETVMIRIIVYSVGGMPVEDVAWGKVCYENAVKMGLGTKLNLWNKPDMC